MTDGPPAAFEATARHPKNKKTSAKICKRKIICVPLHPEHSRRDGRVVDCNGLENRRTERYRGFESLSLRNPQIDKSLIHNELATFCLRLSPTFWIFRGHLGTQNDVFCLLSCNIIRLRCIHVVKFVYLKMLIRC